MLSIRPWGQPAVVHIPTIAMGPGIIELLVMVVPNVIRVTLAVWPTVMFVNLKSGAVLVPTSEVVETPAPNVPPPELGVPVPVMVMPTPEIVIPGVQVQEPGGI